MPYECFNCLGECGLGDAKIIETSVKPSEGDGPHANYKYFCSNSCFKCAMREDKDIMGCLKDIKEVGNLCMSNKVVELLLNSLKTHAPRRMIELYYDKYFDVMTPFLEELSEAVKKID